MKIVSMSGLRCRFISAICVRIRSRRRRAARARSRVARRCRGRSRRAARRTCRPRRSPAPGNTSRIIATRSATVKSGCFSALRQDRDDNAIEQPTPRSMMSTCPLVERIEGTGIDGDSFGGHGASETRSVVAIERQRAVAGRSAPASAAAGRLLAATPAGGCARARPARRARPASRDASRPRSRSAMSYGGSQQDQDRTDSAARRACRKSSRMIAHASSTPQRAMFSRSTRRHAQSRSTNVTCAAPRLSASIPNAPVPAKPSSTRASRDGVPQHVEQRLAQSIRRRPHGRARRRRQPHALETASNDSQSPVPQIPNSPNHPTPTSPKRVGPVRREVLDQRLRGATGVEPRDGFAARVLHQRVIAQQIADAQGRQSGLSRPEEIARAAQRQIALGNHESIGRLDEGIETRRGPLSLSGG